MAAKPVLLTLLLIATGLLPTLSAAREDVRGVNLSPPELKVIDEKCLTCHNRKLIDEAVRERKDMEKVLAAMEKKGVVLTENDRKVIGHFWQQRLFKEKKGETPSR